MGGLQTAHSSVIGDVLKAGFQNFVDQTSTLIATTTTGTPVSGYFYSSIVGRAPIPDITNDLRVSLGIERVATQQVVQLQNEFGPNGEPVFAAVNDDRGLIRFVGSCYGVNNTIGASVFLDPNAYVEITFYGTGLNVLSFSYSDARSIVASVDGGSESVNLYPGSSYANIIRDRNYGPNQIFSVPNISGLGIHTVKIRCAALAFYCEGFEILNSNTSGYLNINTGTSYIQGQKVIKSAISSIHYGKDSTNTTTLLSNGKGGRIVRYMSIDGSISQASTSVPSSMSTLASTNHTNEDVAKVYNWREFGCGRNAGNAGQAKDDFSSLEGTGSDRVFTLDDGTTTLAGALAIASIMNGKEGVTTGGVSNPIIFTFVGTGLDIEQTNNGTSRPTTVIIDGVTLGSTFTPALNAVSIQKIVSGLPYGTHTVKMSTASGIAPITKFIVYQPKKPSIPATAVELCDYNVMADYAATSSADMHYVSTGTLRKVGAREIVYVGTWSALAINVSGFDSGWNEYTQTATSYFQYTFYGTGINFKFPLGNYSYNQTVTVTNVATGATLNLSSYTTSLLQTTSGLTWTASTGAIGGAVSGAAFARLLISGLPLGVYTFKVLQNGTSGPVYCDVLDIITPIHSYKSNLYADIQNTLPVGSNSLMDSRKTSVISTSSSTSKAWAQASGVVSGPTTTSLSAPIPDMSLTVKTSGGALKISFAISAYISSVASPIYFAPSVNGSIVGSYFVASGSGSSAATASTCSETIIVPVAAGVHKVDLYWGTDSGHTATCPGTRRILTVQEI